MASKAYTLSCPKPFLPQSLNITIKRSLLVEGELENVFTIVIHKVAPNLGQHWNRILVPVWSKYSSEGVDVS
jgi:hypothetical protein